MSPLPRFSRLTPAPSFFGGSVDPALLVRCAVCEKPLLGERPDLIGRCESCTAKNAQAVDCGCGFLYEGEPCTCGVEQVTRCPSCSTPTHASESDDDGRCVPCMRAAGVEPITPEDVECCERCGGADQSECTCADDDAYVDSINSLGLRGLVAPL